MPSIKTDSGKMHFTVAGDNSNSSVLMMIHDNGHSSRFFESELKFYSKYFMVILPDMFNHGKSGTSKSGNFWHDNARAMDQICNKLKLRKISIIGVGCGAYAALNFTLINPSLINRVIIDSFPGENPDQDYLERLKYHRKSIGETSLKQQFSAMNGSAWEKILQLDTAMLEDYISRGQPAVSGHIENIRIPLLMTGSATDELLNDCESRLKDLSEKVKKSYVHIFHNGGNPAFITKSDEFRSLSLRFLLA